MHHDSYLKRFFRILLPLGTAAFLYLFFVPLDTVLANQKYLSITPDMIFWMFLLAAVALSVIGSVVLALFPESVCRYIVCILAGFILASFVQLLFFNSEIGVLDGSIPDWSSRTGSVILNIAVWVILLALPLVLSFLIKDGYKTVILAICLAVLCAQSVSLLSLYLTSDKDPESSYKDNYVLNGKDEFTVSSSGSVLVITLDTVSQEYFDAVVEQYPETKSELKDFICYRNALSPYSKTFPSLTHIYTGLPYTGELGWKEYYQEAWNSEQSREFYSLLHSKGYTVNLFSDAKYCAGTVRNLENRIDNLVPARPEYGRDTYIRVFRVACYRLFPLFLKNKAIITGGSDVPMIITTDKLNDTVSYVSADSSTEYLPIQTEESFYSAFQERGIHVTDDTKIFTWLHLLGAHLPCCINEKFEIGGELENPSKEDIVRQTRGFFYALSKLLASYQNAGVYDDMTIIISADHGPAISGFVPILIKLPGQTGDTLAYNNAPVTTSDILPTLYRLIGGTDTSLGKTLYDYSEEDVRERTCVYFDYDKDFFLSEEGVIKGIELESWDNHANVIRVYTFTGDSAVLDKMITDRDYKTLPVKDSLY